MALIDFLFFFYCPYYNYSSAWLCCFAQLEDISFLCLSSSLSFSLCRPVQSFISGDNHAFPMCQHQNKSKPDFQCIINLKWAAIWYNYRNIRKLKLNTGSLFYISMNFLHIIHPKALWFLSLFILQTYIQASFQWRLYMWIRKVNRIFILFIVYFNTVSKWSYEH